MIIPSFIVWIITGLWHGTGKDYLAWGFYWFLVTTISILAKPLFEGINKKYSFRTETFGWKLYRIIRTDFLYLLGTTLVVAGSKYGLRGCLKLFKRIFAESRLWVLFDGSIFKHGMDRNSFNIVIIGIILVMIVESRQKAGYKIREDIASQPLLLRWLIWISLMMAVIIFGHYGQGYDTIAFVYKDF